MAPSPALSILAKAKPSLEGRKVGCLVTDGCDGALVAKIEAAVKKTGAKFEIIAPTVGGVETDAGDPLPAGHKIEGGPSVLFDAVVLLPSEEGAAQLAMSAEAVNFLRDAYGHLKVIGYLPTAAPMLNKAGMGAETDRDRGLLSLAQQSAQDFVLAAAAGRIWEREAKVRLVA
jgi:catalase